MPRTIISILVSAVLLVIAFPQIQYWPLAWIALVPAFLILRKKNCWAAFGWSYLLGFLFFSGTLGWFIYVTYPGAVLLIAYLSLYFAVFGFMNCLFREFPIIAKVFLIPSVWVVLEFIRAHALSGFGWALLGHSQCPNTLLVQIADSTGVYGVSFLVVMVNVLIAESFMAKPENARLIRWVNWMALGIIVAVLAYGFIKIARAEKNPETVTVAVVQPNIAQAIKWDEKLQPWIVQKTAQLTLRLKAARPDLIVWPETSLPGIMSEVPYLVGAIQLTAQKMQCPLLMGAITQEHSAYFNSVYLINAVGKFEGRYDKMHLVPFGEYLPLRPILGWVNQFVPLEDFTPGTRYTIFKVKDRSHSETSKPFGVLICFEDTVAYLWRNFTNAGASFMVNMTNDAWFLDTKAPFIHLQAAIFGCIENRRSLVRAANTGFSGIIDPFGRLIVSVANAKGKETFIEGVASAKVPICRDQTFYTKYGDVFAYLCFAVILYALVIRISPLFKQKRGNTEGDL